MLAAAAALSIPSAAAKDELTMSANREAAMTTFKTMKDLFKLVTPDASLAMFLLRSLALMLAVVNSLPIRLVSRAASFLSTKPALTAAFSRVLALANWEAALSAPPSVDFKANNSRSALLRPPLVFLMMVTALLSMTRTSIASFTPRLFQSDLLFKCFSLTNLYSIGRSST